jgi:hypothetical protein
VPWLALPEMCGPIAAQPGDDVETLQPMRTFKVFVCFLALSSSLIIT